MPDQQYNRPAGAAQARQAARQRQRQRRRQQQIQNLTRAGLLLVILLGLAGIVTAAISIVRQLTAKEELPMEAPAQESILAPLPFQSQQEAGELAPRKIGPLIENTTLTPLAQAGALPGCGTVETSYFSDAAFLGDSITEGLTTYGIDLSGALVCGYIGASPNQVVNRTALKHPERGQEIPLEVLAQAQPAKVYVLMGTNTLVAAGNDQSFLNYYGKMLEELRAALPNALVYVQSVLPVRPEVKEKSPGLENTRLAQLNGELCQMAAQQGMYYLDLWEVFSDEEGNLREEVAQPDGIHLKVAGYQEWVGYLCGHALYNKNNPYLIGSDYSTN